MVELQTGNILEADVEALVNTVNTVGVMGKGVALQFRQAFPENYEFYRNACQRSQVQPGKMLIYSRNRLDNPRFIINFPTKRHWKGKSKLNDIDAGLAALVRDIRDLHIQSIAIPPLGCGNGGLDWAIVRPRIIKALEAVPDVHVLPYEPRGAPVPDQMRVATKRPNMTPSRAALVSLMVNYGIPGYSVSKVTSSEAMGTEAARHPFIFCRVRSRRLGPIWRMTPKPPSASSG